MVVKIGNLGKIHGKNREYTWKMGENTRENKGKPLEKV